MLASRLGTIVAAVALLAGCSSTCNEVGCVNGVEVTIEKEFAVDLLPVEIRMCADEVCRTDRIEPAQTAPDRTTFGIIPNIQLDSDEERDVDVSLEIRSLATGEVLVNATGSGRLLRSQPNGEGCPPTCFGTILRLDEPSSSLVDG